MCFQFISLSFLDYCLHLSVSFLLRVVHRRKRKQTFAILNISDFFPAVMSSVFKEVDLIWNDWSLILTRVESFLSNITIIRLKHIYKFYSNIHFLEDKDIDVFEGPWISCNNKQVPRFFQKGALKLRVFIQGHHRKGNKKKVWVRMYLDRNYYLELSTSRDVLSPFEKGTKTVLLYWCFVHQTAF